METKGFNENELSEQNKEALQSETWQEVRKVMKSEIKHFVDELLKDDPYGYPWKQVVDGYLKNGYKEENAQYELTVLGSTYKVLKREEVTAFYDADGNTLFDVENKRLEKEYGWLMNDSKKADTEITSMEEGDKDVAEEENAGMVKEETDTETGEAPKTERTEDEEKDVPADGTEADDNVIPMGKASLKEIVMGLPAPTTEEIAAAKEENAKPVKQRAKEKLEKEMKADKDKTFAEPVIGYLLKRCGEDNGLAQDVMQEHKTWEKCLQYIFDQARKQAKGNKAAVRDDVVYEWAEDYYRKDDKAEEEKKAKEAAERKKKEEKAEEKPAELPKSKKNPKEMDGQMNLFSMMGM